MLQSDQIEELICVVAGLDKATLVDQFQNFRASFPIDFTHEFFDTQSVDRLRHIFLALCLEQQRLPQIVAEQAA